MLYGWIERRACFLAMPISENTATKIEFSSPLEIVLYPEPVLREKCKTIAVFDESLESLAKEMFDVMYRSGRDAVKKKKKKKTRKKCFVRVCV